MIAGSEGMEPLRVLLLEDDDSDAQLMVHALKQLNSGASIDRAAARKEFTELLAGHQYDIVLADFGLPNWTGMEALRELRRLGFDTPLIVVTGELGDERAVECVKAGAADYILKGNLSRLPIAVKRAVEEKRAQDESLRALQLMEQAQLALEESVERFRKLTDASFDAIHISQDGILQEVNSGFLKMFDYGRMEDVIGRALTDFVAEESRAEVKRRSEKNVEGTYELVGLRKDGKKILLEATARTHAIGSRTVRIAALRDMTERRGLEDQFRQAQKMEAVGRLAGGVAHDFNNLLTVILSYTDMLIEGVSPNDPRADDLTEIRKAAVAAGSLTRQLLAFSRQQVIEPRLVDLNEVVASTEKMLRRLIGEDIEVKTTFSPAALTVLIDPGQLEQVMMNLAVNARDAMPTGGRLTLETESVALDADYARDHWPLTPGKFAMLAVSDIGIGMDEQTRSRIFEPFFTTKGVGKGTGLGLATVYGIVKQSNGFIWVYSEPGKGTSFKIYFPLIDKAPGQYRSTPVSEAPPIGTETIMLAEDSAAVRVAARQILERHGYTVIEAPSGTVALSTARRASRIDLLLTDVVMPEMSGRELAEQFAKLKPHAKVLFMSGYTDDAIVRHGVLRPGTAYLQKPFSPDTLARKVREVLDSSVAQTL
jgi:two-component system, cell cycle sensor histidine kinase and response regulator CckA